MKKLQLADTLALPADEAVTQKYGFIGRSGSGKSYAAMKLAELFLGAGAQVIALDWVGIWWALRLAKSGKAPGFEHVYIFGGEHADVELRPESGALMADLIVDKHISAVLDVMHFRKAERTRFATAFAEQFFHRKKTARTACHLFIEEAQAYLPQMVRGEEARMVGVFEDIGKVGRNYGIGNSLISQRPQAINKDVLNQVEVLLAFQTNGPQERKAIAGWTAENTSAGAAMIQQLPALKVGHALVWSPQWLRIAQEVHIAERDTYNSSSTPTQDAKVIAPKRLSPAELEDLGEAVKQTIEKAKADDPRELKKQLAEAQRMLERQATTIGQLQAKAGKVNQTGPDVHKPALTDADRALLEKLTARIAELDAKVVKHQEAAKNALDDKLFSAFAAFIEGNRDRAVSHAEELKGILESASVKKLLEKLNGLATAPADLSPHHMKGPTMRAETPQRHRELHAPVAVASGPATRPLVVNGELTEPEQRLLNSLAWWKAAGVARPTRVQVAFGARYTLNGHVNNSLGGLRTKGLLDYPDRGAVSLTDAGMALANSPASAASRDDLISRALEVLREEPQKRLFKAVVDAGADVTREDLAGRCGYTLNGHVNNTLGSLRSIGLIDYPRRGFVGLGEMFNL